MSSTFKYDHNRLFDNLESALKNDLASVAVEANGGKSILFVYPPMEDDEYIEEGKDKVEKLSAKLLSQNHLTGDEILEILNSKS